MAPGMAEESWKWLDTPKSTPKALKTQPGSGHHTWVMLPLLWAAPRHQKLL